MPGGVIFCQFSQGGRNTGLGPFWFPLTVTWLLCTQLGPSLCRTIRHGLTLTWLSRMLCHPEERHPVQVSPLGLPFRAPAASEGEATDRFSGGPQAGGPGLGAPTQQKERAVCCSESPAILRHQTQLSRLGWTPTPLTPLQTQG